MKMFEPIEDLEVRTSPIQGRGCFTTRAIKKGEWIIEYTGRRLRFKEANQLYHERTATYLFRLSDNDTVIDGIGVASLVNHSCEPNCATIEQDARLFYFALRDIAAGEELTLDYNLDNSNEREMPCHCGSRKCRGSLYSKRELARRRKWARVAAPPPRKK